MYCASVCIYTIYALHINNRCIYKCTIITKVSVNGAISFDRSPPQFTSDRFPLGGNSEIVAPFWADADNRESGNVWYRESTDSTLLTRVNSEIQAAFPLQAPFAATDLFIAT